MDASTHTAHSSILVSGTLGFFLLICAYSAQYWEKKCHDELRENKEALKDKS